MAIMKESVITTAGEEVAVHLPFLLLPRMLLHTRHTLRHLMHKGPRLPIACLLVPVDMIVPRYLTAVLEQELSRPLKLNPLVAMKRPSWDARAKNPSALNFTACALGRPSFVVPTVDA